MISYFGDYPTSAVVYIPFNTFDSNDPTASVTVTNLVNTDVHIHKDGGTTQRNNAAGITMTVDYDSITGNHLLAIDTSDNTVADFFQAGHEYQVRIEGATVDAGTINAWVGAFSIERSGGALALIKSATYGLSALKAILDTSGVKVASFANDAITAASINTGAIAADAFDQTAADKVWSTTARVLTAGTNLSIPSAADVKTALEADGSKLDHLWEMTEDDGGTRRLTTNSLEQAPSGGLDAAGVAAAVWDAVAASYDDASSMGALLNDAGAGASADTIANAVWDEVLHTDHEVAGSASVLLQGATAPSAADVANAVWDEAIADHTTDTTFGGKNQKVVPSETINDYKATGFSTHSAADVWAVEARVLTANTNLSIPSAADVADAVWDEASTGHTDAGKAGTQLWTVLNDVPSTSEFEARTIAAADYTVVTDLGTVQTGDSYAIVNGDHGLVSIQDDVDSLVAATITNAAGADVAADIIALKAVADLTEDIVRNKLEITDADGAVVLRADNNTDALFTVAACVTDNLTTTIRKRLE